MIPHAQHQTQQDGQADTDHKGIHHGGSEVKFGIAAAEGKGVHGIAQGAGNVNDDQVGQIFHADGQNARVAGKTSEYEVGEQGQHGDHQGVEQAVDQQGGTQDPLHAVVLGGTDVLTHHGTARRGDGTAHQIADDVHLVSDAGNGGHGDAVAVDPEIDEELGDEHRGLTQGHGEAQLDQNGKLRPVDDKIARSQIEAKAGTVAAQVDQRGQETDGLCNDGGQSGTEGLPAKADHKDQIQNDIQNGSNSDEQEGPLGVTQSTHNGADDVVAVNENQAEHAGSRVSHSLIPGFRGRVHNAQDLTAEDQADGRHADGTQDEEGGHGADKAGELVPQTGADVHGDDDLAGIGEAHGQEGQQSQYVAAHGDAGQAGGAHHLTHHDHVHQIVDSLQQVGQEQRDGKHDQ